MNVHVSIEFHNAEEVEAAMPGLESAFAAVVALREWQAAEKPRDVVVQLVSDSEEGHIPPTPEKVKRNRRTKAEIAAADAAQAEPTPAPITGAIPEPVAPQKVPSPFAPQPPKPAAPPTAQDVTNALQAFGKAKGIDKVRDLIKEFHDKDDKPAKRISDIAPASFPFVLSRIAELMK